LGVFAISCGHALGNGLLFRLLLPLAFLGLGLPVPFGMGILDLAQLQADSLGRETLTELMDRIEWLLCLILVFNQGRTVSLIA
jgi:hypothetical protein